MRRFTAVFYGIHACFYCGHPKDCRDHYLPWSVHHVSFTVPCCEECNKLLGARSFSTFGDRFDYLVKRYSNRYEDPHSKHWLGDHLESQRQGTSGHIKNHLGDLIVKRDIIRDRIQLLLDLGDVMRDVDTRNFHTNEEALQFMRTILKCVEVGNDHDDVLHDRDGSL